MRSIPLFLALCLTTAAPVIAAQGRDDGWDNCQAKPSARCLADLAFTIGKTLPQSEADRYVQAEQQSRKDLRGGLEQLQLSQSKGVAISQQIRHDMDMGKTAKAKALLAAQTNRADRAIGTAALAAGTAAHGHPTAARKLMTRAEILAKKLDAIEGDSYNLIAVQALIELGEDAKAQERAGAIAAPDLRAQSLTQLARRQWQLGHKDAARTNLTAAENTDQADLLAIARLWRTFGDQDGETRALDAAERRMTGHDGNDHDFSGIALGLSDLDNLDKARDQINHLPEPLWRAQALIALAHALPQSNAEQAADLLIEAATISGRLTNEADRDTLESQLIHGFALLGERAQASHHLNLLRDPKHRADGLIDQANVTPPRNHAAIAALFIQAQGEVHKITDATQRDLAARDLIWAERRAGLDDAAHAALDEITDPTNHALARAQLGDWSGYDSETKDARPSDWLLQAIATGHAIDNRFTDVLETARRIANPSIRAATLSSSASLAALFAP